MCPLGHPGHRAVYVSPTPFAATAGVSGSHLAIRDAQVEDVPEIDAMLRSLAFLDSTLTNLTDALADREAALTASSSFICLLAETEGQLVGCVTDPRDLALWSGGAVLRVEDLIVAAPAFGENAGGSRGAGRT